MAGIFPSDHHFQCNEAFAASVDQAFAYAESFSERTISAGSRGRIARRGLQSDRAWRTPLQSFGLGVHGAPLLGESRAETWRNSRWRGLLVELLRDDEPGTSGWEENGEIVMDALSQSFSEILDTVAVLIAGSGTGENRAPKRARRTAAAHGERG